MNNFSCTSNQNMNLALPDAKLYQLLGLAMRAGKVISGEELVVQGIRQQRVRLVLLSKDASANTAKKLKDKTKSYQIPLIIVHSRDELGKAIGKSQRVVVGVTDAGFAKQMSLYRQ